MHKLDRDALEQSGERPRLEEAFSRGGLTATKFTNSASVYQYYNLANLRRDIETCLTRGLEVVNICSEPWCVGDLHVRLTGRDFSNADPPVVREDTRTTHAEAFGALGTYLYSRNAVLDDMRQFVGSRSK
jgi:hypothetical protein